MAGQMDPNLPSRGPFYQSPMRTMDNNQQQGEKGPPEINKMQAFMHGMGTALAPPSYRSAAYYTNQNVQDQAGANLPGLLEQSDTGMANIDNSIMQEAATKDLPITDDDLMGLLEDLERGNPGQVNPPKHLSSPMERLRKNSGVGPGLNLKQGGPTQ